jgi:hypothetical protein
MEASPEFPIHFLKIYSIAEYLDAVRACRTLRIEVDSEAWKQVERVVFLKQRTLEDDVL